VTRRGVLILLVLLLGVSGALGDEESARYFSDRGAKALSDKDYEKAEKHFRKALAEHPEFLPAVLGLAETAKAQKKTQEAIGFLESCLAIAAKQKLDEEGEAIRKRALEMLKKLDRARLEYRNLVADYVGKLLKLARRHRKKDPGLTRRCIDRILTLDPDHEEALSILKEVGSEAGPVAKKGSRAGEKQVFNGKDIDNWAGVGPMWQVKDGILTGNAGSLAYRMRNKERIKGDYTLEFEARIVRDTDRVPNLALRYAMLGPEACYALNMYTTGFELSTYDDAKKKKKIAGVEYYAFTNDFDRKAWNLYRFEVKGNKVRISVNGRKLFEHEGDGREGCFDGFVGIVVQHCAAEFRRIAVIQ